MIFVHILWTRKWTIAAVLAACAGAAAYHARSGSRSYHAEAVLQVLDKDVIDVSDSRIRADGNGVIRVSVDASDPAAAARAANALAENYIESDAVARRRTEETTIRSLEARLNQVERGIDQDSAGLRHDAGKDPSRQRRVDINSRIREGILNRIEQAEVSSASAGSDIRWIARAQPPAEPIHSGAAREIGLGGLCGIALGICAALVRHKVDRTIRTPSDALVGPLLTGLGTIPRMQRTRKGMLRQSSEAPLAEQIAWEEKDSAAAESFRGMLASILDTHNGDSRAVRTLVITSPRRGEGKTTVASNLAIALAGTERRVLLIDGDLRRPRLHAVFDVANTSGLSALLCSHSSVLELAAQQMVKATSIPNLSLLPSGPGADGIFYRLYSPRVKGLLARFRGVFDYVIVDTPPALETADARVLARSSDGVIVVVRAKRSRVPETLETAGQFLRDRVPLIGVVLNDWVAKSARAEEYGTPDYGDAREDTDSEIAVAAAALAARLRPSQQG